MLRVTGSPEVHTAHVAVYKREVTRRILLFMALVTMAAAIGDTDAQPPSRRATTVEAIRAYPGFFNAQLVTVLGQVTLSGSDLTLTTDAASIRLVGRERPNEGTSELRGVVYDIGRMNADDPRLLTLDVADSIRRAYGDRWPKPGEEIVLQVTSAGPPPPSVNASAPPIRHIALDPPRYDGTKVSVAGQFRGRNLYADLPDAPSGSREDFVLRSGDASVWVTGLRARGKGFSFDGTRRVDTGRWVRVTGTVRQGRGLVWMEGASIELAEPPTEEIAEVVGPPLPPPPLDIVFTSPTDGEVDVQSDVSIRLQFSRDVDPASLKDRIRISYLPAESAERADQPSEPVTFTTNWTPVNRALQIRPTQPLERFRQLRLELLEGIRGPDGAVLKPFMLTFSTGGS